jgi:tetratricopeptide (TPR) repeat protein
LGAGGGRRAPPNPPPPGPPMRTMHKLIAVAALAITLFLVGGLGVWQSTQDTASVAAPTAADALIAPLATSASLDQTVADLQATLAARPDDARSFALLGIAYAQQAVRTADPSYYSRAAEALRRSLELQPEDNVEALVGMGVVSLARHDFAEGVRWGRQAASINPDSAHILGVIGDGQLELGRYRRAFSTFARMVHMRPDIASYTRISYARELQGDVAGALEVMRLAEQAAGTPEDAAWVSHQIGELHFRSGQLLPAVKAYRRSAALAPSFIPARAGLAKVAWAHGRIDHAIRGYRWVVRHYPLPEHVIALGDLYTIAGRTTAATDAYALARAEAELFRTNGVNVDVELSLFEADHGDPTTALADARAGWRSRHSIHAADALAWALYRNGRYEQAARYERAALHLGTQDASFLFHAGMIQRALGHADAAARYLGDALTTNPSFSIQHAERAERIVARLRG